MRVSDGGRRRSRGELHRQMAPHAQQTEGGDATLCSPHQVRVQESSSKMVILFTGWASQFFRPVGWRRSAALEPKPSRTASLTGACTSAQTCYLYVRTITHEVTGIKPSGFYDPEEERRQALLVAAGEYPDFTSCFLENLEETMREVIRKHKQTPLLLTGSDELSAELVEWFGVTVNDPPAGAPR